MAASNAQLAGPVRVKVATMTNGIATITVSKPRAGQAVFLNGVIISASAAPSAAVEVTITGPEVTIPLEIPASAFAPIGFGFGTHPVPCYAPLTGVNADLVVSVPALGSGVVCSLVVTYTIGMI